MDNVRDLLTALPVPHHHPRLSLEVHGCPEPLLTLRLWPVQRPPKPPSVCP